jgi:hypothetical protein
MADIWSRSSTVDAYICARYVNIRSPETDAVWHYIELMDGLHLAVERGGGGGGNNNKKGKIIWIHFLKKSHMISNQFDRADWSGQCLPDVVRLSGVVCLSEFIEFSFFF